MRPAISPCFHGAAARSCDPCCPAAGRRDDDGEDGDSEDGDDELGLGQHGPVRGQAVRPEGSGEGEEELGPGFRPHNI
jgi:hypothetical protein